MLMNIAINDLDQIVGIKQVERGLACKCYCFECSEPVVARKGEKNEHHFAHSSNKESCHINPESILHKFAKQVIMEKKCVALPPLPETDETEAKNWQFSSLVAEQAVGSIRPDLLASIDNEMLFIEVAVTSFVDTHKLNFIKQLNIKTIEIDLRELLKRNVCIPSDEAEQFILEQVDNKKWLYPEAKKPDEPLADWLSTMPLPEINTDHVADDSEEAQSKLINNYVKHRFIINNVWVDAWVFNDGGISVKTVSYNPEIIALLKQWSKEGGGRYTPKFKAWKYCNPFSHTVLLRLREMDTTPKL